VSVTQPDEPPIQIHEQQAWLVYMTHVGAGNFPTNVPDCGCYSCRVNRSFFRKIWLPQWVSQGHPVTTPVELNYEHDQG
jgi:hypothetical protein